MNINDYSTQASTTMTNNQAFGEISPQFVYLALGLAGKSGEVAEKLKKIIRDKQGIISDDDKTEIAKELGDILWYVNQVSHEIGFTLEEIAQMNLEKVLSRKSRGVQNGSGDNR